MAVPSRLRKESCRQTHRVDGGGCRSPPIRRVSFPDQHHLLVGKQLVEPLLLGPERSFHLGVELEGPRFDVDVPNSLVGDMPVEFRLKLVAPIGPDRVNPERELLDHVVDAADRVPLLVELMPISA